MSTRTRLGRSPIPPPADRYLQITPGRKVPRKGAATRCHALTLSLPFQPSGRVSWRQGREHAPGHGETQGVLRSAAVLLKLEKASRPAPLRTPPEQGSVLEMIDRTLQQATRGVGAGAA